MNKKDKKKLTRFIKGEVKNINLDKASTKEILNFLKEQKTENKNKGGLLVTPKLAKRGY